jgi:exopolysaccharide biosynthesis polyprenyl glycosylphosphotransferase
MRWLLRGVTQQQDQGEIVPGDSEQRGQDAVPAQPVALPAAAAADWLRRYARGLVFLDASLLAVAALVALQVRFGSAQTELRGVPYAVVASGLILLWMVVLGFSRSYESRFLGNGTEEFKRVANSSIRLAAAVALIGYGTGLQLARGFVAIALPLGLVLLVLGRYAARQWLYRMRRRGLYSHRVLVVGSPAQAQELVRQLRHDPLAGLGVVGACLPGGQGQLVIERGKPVPVVGSLSSVLAAMAAVQADTVAVAASPGITADSLRQLSYDLEGTGVDLLVAPALTNVTGTRLSIRPVAGLPLLHLDEPELSGARKVLKSAFDRTVAALAILLVLPVLAGLAVAVRTTSRGPAIFKQERVGRDGEVFCVWKYRSMRSDAEDLKHHLAMQNVVAGGVLFKMKDDPRITPLGRWLRKFSLDELPQLINVLRGDMSLVGPRPPLASEVAEYEHRTHRRLLVKPGMTGLWQVSGRSDLSWEDTVRLDLQYVENWSLGLDLAILAKTVLAVVRGSGAY